MAYCLHLTGDHFDRTAWLYDISTNIIHPPVGSALSPFCHVVSDFEAGLDREEFWLHPEKGIRGVTVRNTPDAVVLSLPTGSGREDFALAWDLMKRGQKHGAHMSLEDEEEILDGSDEQIARISDKTRRIFFNALITYAAQDGATLPVGGLLQIEVSKNDSLLGVDDLEELLTSKIYRYTTAFPATVMGVKEPGSNEVTPLVVYSNIPTLIPKQARLVNISTTPGKVNVVKIEDFIAGMGSQAEDLGHFFFVPELQPEQLHALLDSLTSGAQGKQEVTAEDWGTLAKAPWLIFFTVACADGKVDKKEIQFFRNILVQNAAVSCEILSKMLNLAQTNAEHVLQEITQRQVQPILQLAGLSEFLNSGKISRDEAVAISNGLYALGRAVAASSGGFLGFGSKISKKESDALDLIQTLLSVR